MTGRPRAAERRGRGAGRPWSARSPSRSSLPGAAAAEAAGEFPRDVFRPARRGGRAGDAVSPRSSGGSGQPYEVYLQALEEIAARLDERRRRRLACTSLSCHALAPVRHAGAAGRAAGPDMLARRPARRVRAVGGAGRLGHHRRSSTRAQDRRRGLLAQRRQGVDHPRLAGRLLHDLRPHQRRPDHGVSAASWCRPTPRA